MKCTSCKILSTINDDNQDGKIPFIDELDIKMIKVDENCFPPIIIQPNKIIFNISEIYPEEQNGTCLLFNKTIYSGNFEWQERPDNTYYVDNTEEIQVLLKIVQKHANLAQQVKLL